MIALDILSWFFLVTGAIFCTISGIGLLRLPDFYTRSHSAGIGDTMGAGCILIGLMFQVDGDFMVLTKLVFTLGFILLTSPIACHALVKAAYSGGVRADVPSGGHAVSD